jgi:hypothetical protein
VSTNEGDRRRTIAHVDMDVSDAMLDPRGDGNHGYRPSFRGVGGRLSGHPSPSVADLRAPRATSAVPDESPPNGVPPGGPCNSVPRGGSRLDNAPLMEDYRNEGRQFRFGMDSERTRSFGTSPPSHGLERSRPSGRDTARMMRKDIEVVRPIGAPKSPCLPHIGV